MPPRVRARARSHAHEHSEHARTHARRRRWHLVSLLPSPCDRTHAFGLVSFVHVGHRGRRGHRGHACRAHEHHRWCVRCALELLLRLPRSCCGLHGRRRGGGRARGRLLLRHLAGHGPASLKRRADQLRASCKMKPRDRRNAPSLYSVCAMEDFRTAAHSVREDEEASQVVSDEVGALSTVSPEPQWFGCDAGDALGASDLRGWAPLYVASGGAIPSARGYSTAVVHAKRHIYAFGGSAGSSRKNDMWVHRYIRRSHSLAT
jgi:hypothetical protein